MSRRLLEAFGHPARVRLVDALKRTPEGLAVAELAARLEMSYMGVKDLCTDLQRHGLLETWRQPGPLGRPRLLYRLTPRVQALFPQEPPELTLALLQAAQRLYGPAAPEKLLLVAYQERRERLAPRVAGETLPARARALARLREAEGYLSEVQEGSGGALRILEHHTPVLALLRAYPLLARLETELFQHLLRCPVQREERAVAGQYEAIFTLGPGLA